MFDEDEPVAEKKPSLEIDLDAIWGVRIDAHRIRVYLSEQDSLTLPNESAAALALALTQALTREPLT